MAVDAPNCKKDLHHVTKNFTGRTSSKSQRFPHYRWSWDYTDEDDIGELNEK